MLVDLRRKKFRIERRAHLSLGCSIRAPLLQRFPKGGEKGERVDDPSEPVNKDSWESGLGEVSLELKRKVVILEEGIRGNKG